MISRFLLFVVGYIGCEFLLINASVESSYRRSAVKPGGKILVENCDSDFNGTVYPYRIDVFPAHDESKWRSCNDAYSVTWKEDIGQNIQGLDPLLQWKLVTTMGFCPHIRCQLGNLSHSTNNHCAPGLCYTKLENGARSFGACCFDPHGLFSSGNLIGVVEKTQSVAKPILRHSAVSLKTDSNGNANGDASILRQTFVNANYVHDSSLIVTQCPMAETLLDIQQMILQENIRLWVQIAPRRQQQSDRYANCHLLSSFLPSLGLDFMSIPVTNPLVDVDTVQTDLHALWDSRLFEIFTQFVYKLSTQANVSKLASTDLTSYLSLDGMEIRLLHVLERPLIHIWLQDWPDFDAPPSEFHYLYPLLTEFASKLLSMQLNSSDEDDDSFTSLASASSVSDDVKSTEHRRKMRVAVSCLSGRGRSGTVATMIAAHSILKHTHKESPQEQEPQHRRFHQHFHHAQHAELVSLIVKLRSQRDGMVETPSQYRFLARTLGLSDPGQQRLLPTEVESNASEIPMDSNHCFCGHRRMELMKYVLEQFWCEVALLLLSVLSVGVFCGRCKYIH